MTDKQELKPCREAFEEWHSNRFEQHLPSIRTGAGYYSGTVQIRWIAWKAAWNTRTTPPEPYFPSGKNGAEVQALQETIESQKQTFDALNKKVQALVDALVSVRSQANMMRLAADNEDPHKELFIRAADIEETSNNALAAFEKKGV